MKNSFCLSLSLFMTALFTFGSQAALFSGSASGTVITGRMYIANGSGSALIQPNPVQTSGVPVSAAFTIETSGTFDSNGSSQIGEYTAAGSLTVVSASQTYNSTGPIEVRVTDEPGGDALRIFELANPENGRTAEIEILLPADTFLSDALPESFSAVSGGSVTSFVSFGVTPQPPNLPFNTIMGADYDYQISSLTVTSTVIPPAPKLLHFQGRLALGTNLVNGPVGLALRIMIGPSGGPVLYEDSNVVSVVDGLYSTYLGDHTTTGDLVQALGETNAYLEMVVNGAVLTPRERIAASAYSLIALNAYALAGQPASSYATGTPVYVETDPVWIAEKAGYATGTPLYVESDPGWSGASNLYYLKTQSDGRFSTGTPVYVETDPVWIAEKAGYATGTPLYVESDPVWLAEKSGFSATGHTHDASSIQSGTLADARLSANVSLLGSSISAAEIQNGAALTEILDDDGPGSGLNADVLDGFDHSSFVKTGDTAGGDLGGTYPNPHIAPNSITGADIIDGTISNADLSFGAVDAAHLVNGAVTGDKVASGAISNVHLAAEAVNSATIQDGSIQNADIVLSAVTTATILDGSVTGTDIADGSISNADLSANSFWSATGNSGTVTGTHFIGTTDNQPVEIRANNIISLRILPATLAPNVIAGSAANTISNSAVGSFIGGGISNAIGNVTNSVITGGTINRIRTGSTSSTIGGGSGNTIDTNAPDSFIAGGRFNTISGGVSNSFVAGQFARANHSGSFVWADLLPSVFATTTNNQFLIRARGGVGIGTMITTSNALTVSGSASFSSNVTALLFIGNGAGITNLGTSSLTNGAVTSGKLAAGAVDATALADGSVTANKLAAGSVGSNALASGAVGSASIADGAVTSSKLAAGAVDAVALADGSVIMNKLAAGSVGSNALANGAVGSVSIADGAVTTIALADDAITFDKVHHAGTSVELEAEIPHPSSSLSQAFGVSGSAVGMTRFVVGDSSHDAGATDAGSVHVYDQSGSLLVTVTNPSPAVGDSFGAQVSGFSSNLFVVSAPNDDVLFADSGTVYIYNQDGVRLVTVGNPTPGTNDLFGASLASVGTNAFVVGATGDDTGTNNAGCAYVFNQVGTLLLTVTNPAPNSFDRFGSAVAMLGTNRFVVGASLDDTVDTDAGSVYVYSMSGSLIANVPHPAPGTVIQDEFGHSIAGVGTNRFAVGVPRYSDVMNLEGAVFLFDFNGVLLNVISNPAPGTGDFFGSSVTAVGTRYFLVSAEDDDVGLSTSAGAAYLYDLNGNLLASIPSPSPRVGENFGQGLAGVGSDAFIIGSPDENGVDGTLGSVFLYQLVPHASGIVAQAASSLLGTLGTEQFSAYADLLDEGYLNNDSSVDLLTRGQADGRFFNSSNVLNAIDGTASSPAFSFDSDPDTGMFREDTNTLGFATFSSTRMVIDSLGRIGVGTTTPSNRLVVSGSGAFSAAAAAAIVLENTSAGERWQLHALDDGRFQIVDFNAAATRLIIATNGNVGIGVSNPTSTLQVAGTITCVTLNETSDRNAKENFAAVDADEILDRVSALPVRYWNYKGQEYRHVGPTAQDFHEAFAVGENDITISAIDRDGVALAAIQALAKENESLKLRLDRLEQMLMKDDITP